MTAPVSFSGPLPVALRLGWSVFAGLAAVQALWIAQEDPPSAVVLVLAVAAVVPWFEHRWSPAALVLSVVAAAGLLVLGSVDSHLSAFLVFLVGALLALLLKRRVAELSQGDAAD